MVLLVRAADVHTVRGVSDRGDILLVLRSAVNAKVVLLVCGVALKLAVEGSALAEAVGRRRGVLEVLLVERVRVVVAASRLSVLDVGIKDNARKKLAAGGAIGAAGGGRAVLVVDEERACSTDGPRGERAIGDGRGRVYAAVEVLDVLKVTGRAGGRRRREWRVASA